PNQGRPAWDAPPGAAGPGSRRRWYPEPGRRPALRDGGLRGAHAARLPADRARDRPGDPERRQALSAGAASRDGHIAAASAGGAVAAQHHPPAERSVGEELVLVLDFGSQYSQLGGSRDDGPARVRVDEPSRLFKDLRSTLSVGMSHGDTILEAPAGFRRLAQSDNSLIAAMADDAGRFGIAFHPEVIHTPQGREII